MKYLLACFCTFSLQSLSLNLLRTSATLKMFLVLSVTTLTEGRPACRPRPWRFLSRRFCHSQPLCSSFSGWMGKQKERSSNNRRIPGMEGWHHCFSEVGARGDWWPCGRTSLSVGGDTGCGRGQNPSASVRLFFSASAPRRACDNKNTPRVPLSRNNICGCINRKIISTSLSALGVNAVPGRNYWSLNKHHPLKMTELCSGPAQIINLTADHEFDCTASIFEERGSLRVQENTKKKHNAR